MIAFPWLSGWGRSFDAHNLLLQITDFLVLTDHCMEMNGSVNNVVLSAVQNKFSILPVLSFIVIPKVCAHNSEENIGLLLNIPVREGLSTCPLSFTACLLVNFSFSK